MRQETFFNYKKYFWFWLVLIACFVFTVIYYFDQPFGGPSGSSTLGLSYGVIAALGLCYLIWYGARKRSYNVGSPLKAALSAHLWIGIGLLFLVPLHSGFTFNLSIHSFAYYFLVLTVLTGIWGAINYARLAPRVQSHRGAGSLKAMLSLLTNLTSEVEKLLEGKSDSFLGLVKSLDLKFKPSIFRAMFKKAPEALVPEVAAKNLLDLPQEEREDGLKVISLLAQKRELLQTIHEEVSTLSWLKIWLYFHVPLSAACFLLLVVHIILVFYY